MADGSYTGADNLAAMTAARNYNRFLLQEVLRESGGAAAVVDFGAGSGTFARELRERGLEVVCVEPDNGLRHALQSQGFECRAGVEQIPEDSVDYIFSLNVMEHIEDDSGMFRAIRRRLRPGGRLYLYLPAFPLLYTSMDRKVGHYRRYRCACWGGNWNAPDFACSGAIRRQPGIFYHPLVSADRQPAGRPECGGAEVLRPGDFSPEPILGHILGA